MPSTVQAKSEQSPSTIRAQAEHDTDVSAFLLTTSRVLARAVAEEIGLQLVSLPTANVAGRAIARNSAIILVRSLDEAVDLAKGYGSESSGRFVHGVLGAIAQAGSTRPGA